MTLFIVMKAFIYNLIANISKCWEFKFFLRYLIS